MKRLYILLLVAFAAISCAKQQQATTVIDGFAQGTTYHFVLKTTDTVGLQHQIDSLFEAVNNSMSIYKPGSLINRLNDNQTDTLDAYIIENITIARTVSKQSDGMYDITVKPLAEAWGFGAKERKSNPNIDSLLEFVGIDKIAIDGNRLVKSNPSAQIDLNSIAKGYTVDLLARLMDSRGIGEYLIEVGGEIYAKGKNAQGNDWRVGIDVPKDGNMVPGQEFQTIITIGDIGLATSGNYRKFFIDEKGKKVAHTINPKTGLGEPTDVLSATVLAPTTALADAYGTMMMALGLEKSKEFLVAHPDVEAYIIYSAQGENFGIYCTDKMKERIVK